MAKKKKQDKKVEETKKEKVFKSDVLIYMAQLIAKEKFTREQLIEEVAKKFPDKNKSTIKTYISDARNPKYNPFIQLAVIGDDKIIRFVKNGK